MKSYLLLLSIANGLLVIVDASIGYRVVPLLLARRLPEIDDPDAEVRMTTTVRRMLAAMVAMYMFCTCYAYTRREPYFLLVVTGIILLDIAVQAVLFVKYRHGEKG